MKAKLDAMEATGEDISPIVTHNDVAIVIEGKQYMVAQEVAEVIGGLVNASKLGLSISASWIEQNYKGRSYQMAMMALDPIRKAISKVGAA